MLQAAQISCCAAASEEEEGGEHRWRKRMITRKITLVASSTRRDHTRSPGAHFPPESTRS